MLKTPPCGALTGALLFGLLAIVAVAPATAQGQPDNMECRGEGENMLCDDEIVVEAPNGHEWDARFIADQMRDLERLFQDHYDALNPQPVVKPPCYMDCLYDRATHPSQEGEGMTWSDVNAMSQEACDLVGEVTAIGGIASLTVAGGERWLRKFTTWVARHGGKAAAAKLLPLGTALEIVAGACYISSKVFWDNGR